MAQVITIIATYITHISDDKVILEKYWFEWEKSG